MIISNNKKFKIIEHVVYDEYCEIERVYYTVEELVSGWFGERYKVLVHQTCNGIDSYTTVTTFKMKDEANAIIERLSIGTPRDTIVSLEVETQQED